jgi:hypothetical protein
MEARGLCLAFGFPVHGVVLLIVHFLASPGLVAVVIVIVIVDLIGNHHLSLRDQYAPAGLDSTSRRPRFSHPR